MKYAFISLNRIAQIINFDIYNLHRENKGNEYFCIIDCRSLMLIRSANMANVQGLAKQ